MKKEFTAEEMFGENYLEVIHKSMIEENFGSGELKNLFHQVCQEIESGSITDLELIKLLHVLPCEMTTTIFDELKNRNIDDLISLYDSIIYDEFIKDVITIDENGVSNFEKRFQNQTESKALRKRLLTRYEIEMLIDIVAKKEGLEKADYITTHEKYNGKNKYLTLLIKAHKTLSVNKAETKNNKLVGKIKSILLNKVFEDLNNYEHKLEL